MHLPRKFDGDHSFGLNFNALSPELELGVNGAVEDELLAIRVESRHGRVV